MKGFYTMVKELTDLAGQHEQIAENMASTILKDMQTAVQEVKQERKRVNERAVLCFEPCVTLHTFNSPSSGTTQVSRYQKGKASLDFTEARDSEWQWHQSALPYASLHLSPDR